MPIRCLFLLIFAGSCLQSMAQAFTNPDLDNRKPHQKTIAILPGVAPMTPTRRELKQRTPEQIQFTQDSLGLAFQHDIYDWFMTKGTAGTLVVQDPSVTDSLFEAANLSIKDVVYGEKTNLARILGVDVLLFATLKSKEENGGSTPYYGALDYNMPSLEVFITIDLYDGQDGEHLWGYEGDRDGGYYQSYADKKTIGKLISKAYRLYPYKK
jgi:hypothetical protein